jgi:ABC-type transporter Mla subunit MlaD
VDAAGQTMQDIVASVNQVSTLIAEIAAASQEQSSGIEQVNTAIAQMDQVVQQNASLVEEATAATESMKQQAAALLAGISRFRVGAEPSAAAAHVPASGQPAARRALIQPIRFKPSSIRHAESGPQPAVPARGASPERGQWQAF